MICTIVKVCMRYRGIIDYLGDGPAKALWGSSIWVSLKNEKFTENLQPFADCRACRVKIMIDQRKNRKSQEGSGRTWESPEGKVSILKPLKQNIVDETFLDIILIPGSC